MSRLLFAAARGARVQRQHFQDFNVWEPSRLAWVVEPKDCDYTYRIHPDDEHLQYGPISTALREQAKAHPKIDTYGPYNSCAITAWATDADFGLPTEQRDIPLFLLFLAEALADEGL